MKIAIIGGGNAGVWTALHYAYYAHKNIEIELIHDPDVETFPVGQGMTPGLSRLLYFACDINWYYNEIRATPKLGILYENWSKRTPNLFHEFPFHESAMQADPKYLQKYILNSGLFTVKEGNVTDLDTVDADVIFDCRGNTKKNDIEYESLYCPVNSVLLAIGPQNEPQLWSKHVATSDGWTFVIPNTEKTLSYGYLYNSNITSEKEAKANFRELFEHEDEIVNLPFKSYLAKEPLRIDSSGRKIILNGNRLSFFEPMEATAILSYLKVATVTFPWVMSEYDRVPREAVMLIKNFYYEIQKFILYHYIKGSVYDTPFWRDAQTKTTAIFEQPDEKFQSLINYVKSTDYIDLKQNDNDYGPWNLYSIKRWYEGYINKQE